jgi:8-oxo-dGTP diphosphatase
MTNTDEVIRYTADAVVITAGPAPHVLLIKRGWPPYAGCWALPGGHVDAGETSVAASARELNEETSVQVDESMLRQVGAYDAPGRDPRGRYVTVAYAAVLSAPAEPTAKDDAAAARWWPVHDLPQDLAFDHGEILRDALRTCADRTT